MGKPRILVIDGNRAATRDQQVAAGGRATGEGYVSVLQRLAPLDFDIVRPADGVVQFPAGVGLGDYDGAAITGSALTFMTAVPTSSGKLSSRAPSLIMACLASAAAGACRWRSRRSADGCAPIRSGANSALPAESL